MGGQSYGAFQRGDPHIRRRAAGAASDAAAAVTAAVVVAAGSSSRMGIPKQLIPLCGVPVIARTLMALDEAQCVDEIVLVARQEDMLPFYDLSKRYGIRKLTKILIGGASRQRSVAEVWRR